jgi:hypothetical protein
VIRLSNKEIKIIGAALVKQLDTLTKAALKIHFAKRKPKGSRAELNKIQTAYNARLAIVCRLRDSLRPKKDLA